VVVQDETLPNLATGDSLVECTLNRGQALGLRVWSAGAEPAGSWATELAIPASVALFLGMRVGSDGQRWLGTPACGATRTRCCLWAGPHLALWPADLAVSSPKVAEESYRLRTTRVAAWYLVTLAAPVRAGAGVHAVLLGCPVVDLQSKSAVTGKVCLQPLEIRMDHSRLALVMPGGGHSEF
jgi:hypothetical protein